MSTEEQPPVETEEPRAGADAAQTIGVIPENDEDGQPRVHDSKERMPGTVANIQQATARRAQLPLGRSPTTRALYCPYSYIGWSHDMFNGWEIDDD